MSSQKDFLLQKLERSNSGKKLLRHGMSPKKRNGIMMQSKYQTVAHANYRNGGITQIKQYKQGIIQSEYAISGNEGVNSEKQKSRSSSRENRFKSIEKKYVNKLENEIQTQRKSIKERKSCGSKESSYSGSQNTSPFHKGRLRVASISTKKDLASKPANLVVRSEKYIKMKPYEKDQVDKKDDAEMRRLEKEISDYREKYQKALKALENINQAMTRKGKEYNLEKQVYEQKIRILKSQLESKNMNKNSGTLGHLYFYKQFDEKKMIPDSLILECPEEGQESKVKSKSSFKEGEKLVEEYAQIVENNSSLLKSNLSIESK